MSKAVFFDIDGTLFSLEKGVIPSTRKALELLKKTDTLSAICTGRCRAMMEPTLEKMSFPVYICGAGTYIEYNGKVVYNCTIPVELTDEVVKRCKEAKIFCVMEGPEWIYYDKAFANNETCISFFNHMKIHMAGKLIPYKQGNTIANKYSLFLENDSNVETIMPFLEENFDIIRHSDFMEILPKGHSKATGIDMLIKKLGIKRSDTYAFGDSSNDLEMLAYVQYGIAMGNSCEQVLKEARYVTKDMDDDGIAWGLCQFGLISSQEIMIQ